MAKPKAKKARKREKKNVIHGQAHIKSTFNNTIVSVSDADGNVVAWASAGTVIARAAAAASAATGRLGRDMFDLRVVAATAARFEARTIGRSVRQREVHSFADGLSGKGISG